MLTENSTFESFLEAAKDKRVVGFGASNNVAEIVEALSEYNITLDYIVDNNFWKWNSECCGIKVCSPAKLKEEKAGTVITLICSNYIFEIEKQLNSLVIGDYFAYGLWIDLIFKHSNRGVRINLRS